VHSEVTRDKNYHDYHANDVEEVHFVSSSRGTVHLRTERDCRTLGLCPAGLFILRYRRGVTRRINANGGNRNSLRRRTERQAQR
jgi:hypothetical protein